MHGSATVVVRGIGVRALLQKERNEVVAAVPGGQDQRRGACAVLAVGIGACTDECPSDVQVARRSCEMQRAVPCVEAGGRIRSCFAS